MRAGELGGDGSGSNASNGERLMKLCLPLTSCCAARFLTGHGLVPVRGPGVGDPCSKPHSNEVISLLHTFFFSSLSFPLISLSFCFLTTLLLVKSVTNIAML